MPIERVSRSFKDISISFDVNPLTNDILVLKNETAIARSIRNLISTVKGEAFYSDKGSNITNLLFENMDPITASLIQSEASETIRSYEPRVSLIDVRANPDYDNNNYNVVITYDIIGINAPTQQLTLVLETVR
jgi:phage baseplate assembly protein W